MKKRGVSSPDRADAVFGAMTPVRDLRSYNLVTREYAGGGSEGQWQVFGEEQQQQQQSGYVIPGADFS